jgi:hypothetical protein
MNGILTTDHPAWHVHEDGTRARAVRTASGIWVLSFDERGLHMECVQGTEDVKPTFITTDPACLPGTVPAALRSGLTALDATQRLANPWLWDAITTAVLRQVVRAEQARKLYRVWCHTFGTSVQGPFGDLAIAPGPAKVLALSEAEFANVGAKFHRTALQAAATSYERHHGTWEGLDAADLVTALKGTPRIGPWRSERIPTWSAKSTSPPSAFAFARIAGQVSSRQTRTASWFCSTARLSGRWNDRPQRRRYLPTPCSVSRTRYSFAIRSPTPARVHSCPASPRSQGR